MVSGVGLSAGARKAAGCGAVLCLWLIPYLELLNLIRCPTLNDATALPCRPSAR